MDFTLRLYIDACPTFNIGRSIFKRGFKPFFSFFWAKSKDVIHVILLVSNGHGLDQCSSENSGCHWRFELKFRGKKKWNLYLALGKVWYRVQARIQEQLCMPSWVFKEEICPQKMLKRCVYLE